MSTKSKFTIILVLTSLIGALVFGLLSYLESRDSLREAAFQELTAIRTARVQQVEEYFASVGDEASVITENPTVQRALVEFRNAFDALETSEALDNPGFETELEAYYDRKIIPLLSPHFTTGDADAETLMPLSRAGRYLQNRFLNVVDLPYDRHDEITDTGGTTLYERAHAELHDAMKFIRDEFEYYDIFLIDAQSGDIIYSVEKEADFGTNIFEGPYRGSGLAELVETIRQDPTRRAVHMTDMEFYIPSLGKPAFFVGSSIYDGNRVAGVLAIQLTHHDLNDLMTAKGRWAEIGLKSSGETYLVGEDGYLRNESRFFVEDRDAYLEALKNTQTSEGNIARIREKDTSILLQRVDTEATRTAFAGQTETRVTPDYRGVDVLSSFSPINVDGRNYAVLAEMDATEAFQPVRNLTLRMLITTAIVIPLTALLGIWIGSSLMRPATEMRQTARRFLEGEEDTHFQSQSTDEWGQLGQELNRVLDVTKSRLSDAEAARGEVRDIITRLMPPAIGERYQQGETQIVSHAEMASSVVFFLIPDPALNDLENAAGSASLYDQLDDRLDEAAEREGVDLLNQAGMHYVGFCGLTTPMTNHAERLYRFCERARSEIAAFNAEHGTSIAVKLGFSTAPMFGALVGNTSTAYEIWGDTIHLSFDLAHAAPPGALYMTKDARKLSGIDIKGKSVKVPSLSGQTLDAIAVTNFMTVVGQR